MFHIHFTISNRVPNTFYRLKQGSTFTSVPYRVPHTLTLYRFKQGSTSTLVPYGVPHTLHHFKQGSKYFLPFQTGFEIHFSSIQCSTYTFLSYGVHFTVSKKGDIDITVSNRVRHSLYRFKQVSTYTFLSYGVPHSLYRFKQGATYTLPFQTGFHIRFPFIRCSTYTLPF